MEYWREDLPSDIKLVITDKVRVVSFERIENERLVRLWDLRVGESLVVRQVELDGDRSRGETRQLGVHLHVNGFGRLDSEDKLVSGDVVEDAWGGFLELDTDFDLAVVEG